MITLIIKDKLNIFINEETGRWFCFKSNLKNQVIRNIKTNTIKDMYNKYIDFKPLLEEIKKPVKEVNNMLNDMNYLIFHTTDACNMRCKYCYAEDNICENESNFMTSETMIKSINKFYKNKQFFVLFHGREPLTNYKNIIDTVKYYKNNGNITFILQTNGLLLDDKKIKELNSYNIIINVSVDGFDDESNSLRINGLTNLDYTNRIKKIIIENKISPIIIVHQNNYKKIPEITEYLIENKINGASYNFLWPTNENKELSKKVIPCEELLKIMKQVINISIKDSDFIFKERDLYLLYGRILKRHINNYMCNSSPCGAGKNCLSIYKDGEIYPCTMVNNQKENYLGSINNTYEEILNKDVVLKRRDINKIKDCSICPLRIFCKGGGCPGFIYNLTNNVNEKSIYCDYYYEIIIYMIKKIFKLSNKKYFINF